MNYTKKIISTCIIGMMASSATQAAHRCDSILSQSVADEYKESHQSKDREALKKAFCSNSFNKNDHNRYHFDKMSSAGSGGGISVFGLFDIGGQGSSSTTRDLVEGLSTFEEKREAVCSHYGLDSSYESQRDIFKQSANANVVKTWSNCMASSDQFNHDDPLICSVSRQGNYISIDLNSDNSVLGRITNLEIVTDNLKLMSRTRKYLNPGNTTLTYKVEDASEDAMFNLYGDATIANYNTTVEASCQQIISASELKRETRTVTKWREQGSFLTKHISDYRLAHSHRELVLENGKPKYYPEKISHRIDLNKYVRVRN